MATLSALALPLTLEAEGSQSHFEGTRPVLIPPLFYFVRCLS